MQERVEALVANCRMCTLYRGDIWQGISVWWEKAAIGVEDICPSGSPADTCILSSRCLRPLIILHACQHCPPRELLKCGIAL